MVNFLKSLFGNNKEEATQTTPILDDVAESFSTVSVSDDHSHQLVVGYCQSVGLQREHNEDALFTLSSALTSGENTLEFGLYIIADGMGGHQHGEIASEVAIRALSGCVIRKVFVPMLSTKPAAPEESLQEIMREGMVEAHRTINKQAPGGGTTVTALLLLGDQITIAHVGDSRAYILSQDGNLQCLTRDHSLVNRLLELGQLSLEEAANHPQRNVLYRALGQGDSFEPDIQSIHIVHNQSILLCSDGLWGVIPETTIIKIIQENTNPSLACQQLVDAANDAGGPDNISAILIQLPK